LPVAVIALQQNCMKTDPVPMCPSAPPKSGALLLGRFTEEGRLAFAAEPLPVTGSFLARAEQGGDVGKRFRFASRCMESACSRWQNGKCTVGLAAMEAAKHQELKKPLDLPACAIRSQCRWFAQEGEAACKICPLVVYDMNDQSDVPT
jgi:hypothetical protein